MPQYAVKINDKQTLVTIDGVESEECPVSLLTRASWGAGIRYFVTEIGKAVRVKETTGAWPGGMDSGRWDPRYYDAVELAHCELRRYENAIDDACSKISQRPAGGMA